MKKKILDIDTEIKLGIIGICSIVKDYRLCWEINKLLDLNLNRNNIKGPKHISLEEKYKATKKDKNLYTVYGKGLGSFRKKKITKIFVGNSGTTCRLLFGLLSTHSGKFYLHGDSSMNKRDMSRIIKPLEKIGCFFYPPNKTTLPLTIEGTDMPLAQKHLEKIGSAQVKSSILLASLATAGITTIEEEKSPQKVPIFFHETLGGNHYVYNAAAALGAARKF